MGSVSGSQASLFNGISLLEKKNSYHLFLFLFCSDILHPRAEQINKSRGKPVYVECMGKPVCTKLVNTDLGLNNELCNIFKYKKFRNFFKTIFKVLSAGRVLNL